MNAVPRGERAGGEGNDDCRRSVSEIHRKMAETENESTGLLCPHHSGKPPVWPELVRGVLTTWQPQRLGSPTFLSC